MRGGLGLGLELGFEVGGNGQWLSPRITQKTKRNRDRLHGVGRLVSRCPMGADTRKARESSSYCTVSDDTSFADTRAYACV